MILKNAMLKAVIEVYSELFVTNCYSQISCSRHSKFVKIIPILIHSTISATTQKMRFSIKDVFSKCDQIRWKLQIWSHLQKKSLMENFIFCVMRYVCLRKLSCINQIDFVSYMSHKFRAEIMEQLNFVQWLQISNQKEYSDFDTGRSSSFLSQ